VCGWDQLRQRFGTRPFADLLAPTIKYAEAGVPVPEVIAGYWRASTRLLAADPGSAETFLVPDGTGGRRPPRAGELFKNPGLAATLKAVAAGGRDAFYKGDTAAKLVALSDKVGGLFSQADFDAHGSEWVDPVSVTYRGHEVWELPPPGQGIAALQMLNLLEPYDLKKWGPTSPDYWHTLVEAKKLAYADRARYYADPLFSKVPVQRLIGKEYADARRPGTPRWARRTPSTCAWWTRTATACRSSRATTAGSAAACPPRARGSASRTAAACSAWTRPTPTPWNPASGRSTPSSRPCSRRRAAGLAPAGR
jgi:gamma-glutamyltranspeptidase/glutathione hydrolase